MKGVTIQAQRGMALFVSLMFLLLLTIVGVAAMQNASMQEKMAGNTKLKNESFQYAEAALREGEGVVMHKLTSTDCAEHLDSQGPDLAGATQATGGPCDTWLSAADNRASYYIQKLGISKNATGVPLNSKGEKIAVRLFRVTARATVGNSTSVVESIYARSWN